MKFYVIYHKTFTNTNVITTDENQINIIINHLINKYQSTNENEWFVREILEGEEFEADMDM